MADSLRSIKFQYSLDAELLQLSIHMQKIKSTEFHNYSFVIRH